MSIFTLPLFSFVLCVILHLWALKYFPKLGLLDFPERYGLTRESLPYPTGILAVCTFLTMFWYSVPWTMQSAGIIVAIVLLAAVSILDDRHNVPAGVRLFVQAAVALIVFATGSRIYTLTNPLLADGLINLDTIDIIIPLQNFPLVLPLWSGIFTMFWLMLTMNALNWFDGIPGQVSTLSVIGFAIIGCLSLSARVDQPELAVIAFSLSAIAAACFLFDSPFSILHSPFPRVLMGDTGAMFFGFALGLLTIYSGGKVATAFLVLGVPLIDLFIVVVRRIFKGKNPMKGNTTNEHLHHRLLAKGWSQRQVIALTAALGSTFGVTALFLSTTEKILAAGVLFLVMLGLSWYSKEVRTN